VTPELIISVQQYEIQAGCTWSQRVTYTM